jgi:hypothetical protein
MKVTPALLYSTVLLNKADFCFLLRKVFEGFASIII